MKNFTNYARAWPTETSEGYLWDVFCLDCEKSIGTMHSVTLQEAILAMSNKGGVKCPNCRAVSCDHCGENHLVSRGRPPNYWNIPGLPSPVKLCYLCKEECRSSGRVATLAGQ